MSNQIIVNVEDDQTRIAIVEDGKIAELYIENAENERTIGNMYLGRIRKVMPSIQAAFVDIGKEQDAFLHFSDVSNNLRELKTFLKRNPSRVEDVDVPKNRNNVRASNLLNRGQDILAQVTKEPISNKGSRISTDLSMAGRFLVLMPLQSYVAVSRKVTENKERRRLEALASSLVPDGFGVIVRTVAEGRDAKSLDKDLKLLMERWRRVEKKLSSGLRAPSLVHEDVDMASSIIRDQFSDEYDRILVDNKSLFHSIRSYVRAVAPKMVDRVELHDSNQPIFESSGIQGGADRAFKDRVELPSGGYLFIEQTEAMHVVDVNSGRSGRGKSQKQNSLDVNLEAARVIARQIRLRDLGGIIVVDFIDLRSDKDKKKVYDELEKGFAEDRAVTKVLPMSDFGLVEITRQRLRPSITTTFSSSSGSQDEDGSSDGQPELRRAERHIAQLEQAVEKREQKIDSLQKKVETQSSDDRDEHEQEKRDEELSSLRTQVQQLKRELSSVREAKEQAETELKEQSKKQSKTPAEASRTETPTEVAPARDNGEADTLSPDALVQDLEQWIANHKSQRRTITVRVHPFTAAYLTRPVPSYPTRWFMDYLVRVHLETDSSLSPLAYRVVAPKGEVLATAS
jgi:ribonuclease G